MWVKNEKCDFEIDDRFAYLINMCSFHFRSGGYIEMKINKQNLNIFSKFGYKLHQNVRLHRILFELHVGRKLHKDEHVDHIDTIKTNNKIQNLRILTNSQNRKNRKLKNDQIYYNIYYHKNQNYFVFSHQEKKIKKMFKTLHEALAFFLDYDKNNDFVLTKHIHNMKPIEEIENIVLKPDARCEKCNSEYWCKSSLKQHQKKCTQLIK